MRGAPGGREERIRAPSFEATPHAAAVVLATRCAIGLLRVTQLRAFLEWRLTLGHTRVPRPNAFHQPGNGFGASHGFGPGRGSVRAGGRGGGHRRVRGRRFLENTALHGGIAPDYHEPRVARLERDDPAPRIFDVIEGLVVAVAHGPVAPAMLPVRCRDPAVHVQPVAMLEPEVAFVDGFEAGAAREGRNEREREKRRKPSATCAHPASRRSFVPAPHEEESAARWRGPQGARRCRRRARNAGACLPGSWKLEADSNGVRRGVPDRGSR